MSKIETSIETTYDACIICGHFMRDDSKPCVACNGGVAAKKRNRGKVPWRNSDYASYERDRAAREGFGE